MTLNSSEAPLSADVRGAEGAGVSPRRRLLPFVIIALAGLLAFGQAFFNEYAYDSDWLIPRAQRHPLSAVAALGHPQAYSDVTGIMSYRPLSALFLLALDAHLFRGIPALSHGLNLAMHFLNASLLYLIARGWAASRRWPSPQAAGALAAGVLLLHPLVSETVLCAGFRFDLGAVLGLLAGLWLIESGAARRLGAWGGGAALAACLLIGLGFKESPWFGVAAFPAYMVLREGAAARRRAAAAFLLCAAAAGAFFLVWRQFKYGDYTSEYLGGEGRLTGMANFATAFGEVYLRKLALPWPLRVDYAFEPIAGPGDRRLAVAGALIAAVLAAALTAARRNGLALFALAWIALGFVPVSQITPVPDPVAERFWYMPMAGAGLFVAAVAGRAWPRSARGARSAAAAAALVGVVWLGLSFRRSMDWRDDITLNIANWEQAKDERPQALEALAGLYLMKAAESLKDGRGDLAAQAYGASAQYAVKLIRGNPRNAQGYRLSALAALSTGDGATARFHAAEALRLAPDDPQVRSAAVTAGVLAAAEAPWGDVTAGGAKPPGKY